MTTTPSVLDQLTSFQPGYRIVDGGDLRLLANLVIGSQGGLTALAGGTQTVAANLSNLLDQYMTEFTTVATANDSAILPPAIPGTLVLVVHDDASHAVNLAVYTYPGLNPLTGVGDQVIQQNSTALQSASTATTIGQGHASYFACVRPGIWKQITA